MASKASRARRKINKGAKIDGGFVPLPWDILNSPAYTALKASACKILPFFLGKPKISLARSECYEMEFEFTYTEATSHGLSNATFRDARNDLIAKGFIDPTDKGGLRGAGRSSNKYRLSKRWKKYGQSDFENIDYSTMLPKK